MKKKRLLTDRSGDLQDKILADQADALAREIDREVMWSMLQSIGWKRVVLSRFTDNKHAIDITYWVEENVKGAFERHGKDFIFEDPKDATWFILKWQ